MTPQKKLRTGARCKCPGGGPCAKEEKVKAEIKAAILERWPNALVTMPVQTGYGQVLLDFVCCIEGVYVEIEAKRKCGVRTKRQDQRLTAVFNAGGEEFLITGLSAENDSLDRAISRLEKRIHAPYA